MQFKSLFYLVVISVFSSSCATQSVLHSSKSRTKNTMYVNHFVKGVFTKDDVVALCLNGNNDLWHSENPNDYNYKGNIEDIETSNFMITYKLEIVRSQKTNNYDFPTHPTLVKTHTFSNCDNMPTGANIKYPKNITVPSNWDKNTANELNEKINNNYPNQIIFINNTMDRHSYGFLFITIGNNAPHKRFNLANGYYVEDSECIICYAGLPFSVAIDIITFPFQLLWLLTSARWG